MSSLAGGKGVLSLLGGDSTPRNCRLEYRQLRAVDGYGFWETKVVERASEPVLNGEERLQQRHHMHGSQKLELDSSVSSPTAS